MKLCQPPQRPFVSFTLTCGHFFSPNGAWTIFYHQNYTDGTTPNRSFRDSTKNRSIQFTEE